MAAPTPELHALTSPNPPSALTASVAKSACDASTSAPKTAHVARRRRWNPAKSPPRHPPPSRADVQFTITLGKESNYSEWA